LFGACVCCLRLPRMEKKIEACAGFSFLKLMKSVASIKNVKVREVVSFLSLPSMS
jgi:hypothetical protein